MHRPISTLGLAVSLALACGHREDSPRALAHAETIPSMPAATPPAPAEAPRPAARPATHPVFSLADNRHLAHVQRHGGLVVVAGSPGFAKYLRFAKPKLAFTLGQVVDARKVALSDSYATIDVPLTDGEAASLSSVTVRLKTDVPRRMTLVVNMKPAGTITLAAGWQTAVVPVAAGLVRPGENTLQLIFARGPRVAIDWLQVGGQPGGDDAPTVYDAKAQALLLPEGDGLAYYVEVPANGALVGDLVGDAACRVVVRAHAHDGPPVAGVLAGAGSTVDLGALAGKIARLELTGGGCPMTHLAAAALVTPGALPEAARAAKPKHIVFWIMDSLRADRVKPFFPKARPEVPGFEALAGTSTIFKNTYVQGNESRASHASIWSSLYPVNHKMIKDGASLDPRWTTLGEAMKGTGLFTSGVSANGYIVKRWGFGDGWDAYRNHIHDGGGVRGEDVLKYGLASIDPKHADPFFLYLGSIDTHVSWRAKEPWFARYDSSPYSGRFVKEASGKDVALMATGRMKITDRDKTRIIAIYDSNVSYQDDLVTKLEDKLAAWGIADDTMLVVTADHGDEQWEDGRVGHGGSLRESLIHVPLLIHYPPLFPAGVVEEGVDTIDILPTLLDAMGSPPPPEAQGASLLPLAQGVGRGYPRPSIASQYEFAHAMRLAGWKVRVAGSAVPLLYHIEDDPYERTNLAATRPLERRMLTDVLSTFLVLQKDWRKSRWGVASNATPDFLTDLER